jgi:hypothetical protein
MCNSTPNNTRIFAEIFFREAYYRSLTEVNQVPILWKSVLNFVQRHIEPDGATQDEHGHTPAGSKADAIVAMGLSNGWITKKARGRYLIDPNGLSKILLSVTCTPVPTA